MEINGKEFIRNVEIEKEKEELRQKQDKLDGEKRPYIQPEEKKTKREEPLFDVSLNSDPTVQNEQSQEYDVQDILLADPQESKNKKKYIVLGFGLVVLFMLTMVIIRVTSNSSVEKDLKETPPIENEVVKDDILNKLNTNEEYINSIEKKQKKKVVVEQPVEQKQEIKEIVLPEQTTDDAPLLVETPKVEKKPKRDLFGLDSSTTDDTVVAQPKKEVVVKKDIPVKVSAKPKRKLVLPPPQETNFTVKPTPLDGYYIQLGAFTKPPSKAMINKIKAKGYKVIVHKMSIKGTLYNKVLIGSYSTRAKAQKILPKVRRDMNNPNAYILKF